MDIDTAFTDPAAEEEGVWVKYRDGSEVKVARVGNPKFQRRLDAKMRPHRRKEQAGTMDVDVQNRILCECMSETILLDWKGFTRKGKPVAYSPDAATELLLRSMDFRNDMTDLAASEEHFRTEELEEDAKN